MQHVQNRSTTSALVLTAVLIALATLFTMYTVYNNKTTTSALVATIVGGIIIVAGYFIAEYFVFDPGVAIASIVTNTIQAVMSVIVSMILYAILRKRLG